MKEMWSRNKALRVTVFVMLGAAALVGVGFVVMWLWNWLVPELFGGPTIDWPKALGLFGLSRLLFGGFGSDNSDKKKKEPELSDDERARLKQLLRERATSASS